MGQFPVFKWFLNISIAKKLYFTIGTMAILIALELFTLWFSIYMLSAVRASVEEEGRWSKAQKDAVYTIQKYAQTGDENDYAEFQDHLKINYGNKRAFGELEKERPDQQIMMVSWVEAGMHPDDVERVTKLFVHFGFVSYIKRCIEIYHEADMMMDELETSGMQLHLVINESDTSSNEKIEPILDRIDRLNRGFTYMEIEFSTTLGEGARWLEGLVLRILFAIALTVEISGLLLTISLSRGISKGINEIIRVSKKVASGNFKEKAVAYSKDEIGQLAISFNEMTNDLDRNTNELKKSEEKLQQFKHFFINSNDLACIANVQGYFEVLNPKFEKVLGYSEKELLENQFLSFIHPDDTPATLQEIEKLKTGATTINFVNRYRKKDGDYLWFDWNSTPDPATGKLYAIARDITEQKHVQDALKKAKDLLEHRVKERTAELEEVNTILINRNKELKKINEDLDNFIYSASHDLKTPILNLEALFNVLNKRIGLEGVVPGISEKINLSIKQIGARISRLAQITKVQKNLFDDVSEIRFSELLEDILLETDEIIRSSGVKITHDFSAGEHLKYSGIALKSILYNLLTNAIKYYSPKRQPEVFIKTRKEKDFLILSVKDNGLGIDLDRDKEKLFAMFKRLHDHVEGTGIGLYMVKRIIENNGGKIEVESELGKGTTFYVYFSLDR